MVATSAGGGWTAEPESVVAGDGSRPRSIDILLTRVVRREVGVVQIWVLILDGSAVMRDLEAKVHATRHGRGQDWHVQGLLIVRGTRRNRRLVGSLAALFTARYPASSHAWRRALRDPATPMPGTAGFAWTDVVGTSLIAARLTTAA